MHSLDSKKVQKRLAKYVKELPSESVAALAETDDQIKYLTKCQTFNKRVGESWHARCSGQHDPLRDLIEQEEISAAEHRQIYYLVRFFESLWGVVNVGWVHIKSELASENQFKSAQQLFEAILRVWFDNKFAVCLEPHWELTKATLHKSFGAIKDYTNSQQQGAEINPELNADIRSLTNISSHMGNPWLLQTLSICHGYAKKNGTLRDELNNFYSQIASFAEFGEDWSSRKRGSKEYPKLKTTRFIDGHSV
jgi:hypothetical protein